MQAVWCVRVCGVCKPCDCGVCVCMCVCVCVDGVCIMCGVYGEGVCRPVWCVQTVCVWFLCVCVLCCGVCE